MNEGKYWKHPEYGHVYCGELVTPQGRVCWPSLVKPKDPPPSKDGKEQGKPRYEATILFDKKDPKIKRFVTELEELVNGGVDVFNKGRSATIGLSSVFGKNGDGDAWDHEKYPYYKGCWVMTARNAEMMQLVDKKREKLTPEVIKGGMPVRFVVTPLITAHGASYKLLVLQTFDDDGIRFGGGAREVLDLLTDLEEAAKDTSVESGEEDEAEEEVAEEEPAPKPAKQTRASKGKAAAVNLLA